MRLSNISIKAVMMASAMMMPRIASARSTSFLVNRARRTLPSYLLKKYGYGRRNASSFCCNTMNGHVSHRACPCPPLRGYSRNQMKNNNHALEKSRFVHSWRFRTTPMTMLGMHSNSIAEQQSHLSTESKSDTEPQTCVDTSNLSEMIRESYDFGETDGVQHALSSNNILNQLSTELNTEEIADQLVGAAIEAAGKNRGRLAAMINAIIASCCGSTSGGNGNDKNDNIQPSSDSHPQIALDILSIMDEMHSMDSEVMIAPDIVSLSLVYYSLQQQNTQELYESESRDILERAQRLAKKMAGSQRRKALAAERRRGGSSNNGMDSGEVERKLQSLYGPDMRVLQETEDVIVISKPSGMVTYHTKKTTAGTISKKKKKKRRDNSDVDGKGGGKRMDISLVDALLDVPVALSTLNPTARGVVHRLDRGTSGSIVMAKTDEVHLKLVASFFLRKAKKNYLAMVPGCGINNGMNVAGDDGVGNLDSKQLTMGITGIMEGPVDGRPARSSYEVVKVFEGGQQPQQPTPEALLLKVETLTGRKHQVRVHCASLGHPIFLDPLYYSPSSESQAEEKPTTRGERKKMQKKKRPPFVMNNADESSVASMVPKEISDLGNSNGQQERFFLHAASLSIPELDISVDAPLPTWWVETMDQLDNK